MKKAAAFACLITILFFGVSCSDRNSFLYKPPTKEETREEMVPAKKAKGELIWHGNYKGNIVYLTFDDGPSSKFTPQVLDILKKENVKATFFVLGKFAEKYPSIVKREYDEGHTIGNHTYSHISGYAADEDEIISELSRTDDIVKRITGSSPKYFRPPFGFFNYRFFIIAEGLDYRTVLWTIDVADWTKIKANEIEYRLISKVKGGYIVLLHDGGENREELIKALPAVIEKLRAKGFQFRPL